MLVLQVNLIAIVLFGAYLAGYLGPSMEFPQGAGRIIPAAELDARNAARAERPAQAGPALERRNRSGTTRRAAPIPIDVPIPIARPPRRRALPPSPTLPPSCEESATSRPTRATSPRAR